MDCFTLEALTFFYPSSRTPALDSLSLSLRKGQFIVLCGPSGCGKSTLLRQLKPALAPHGRKLGALLFEGIPLYELDTRSQSAKIGFIAQNPENQIVTDKVWHELAFGLESLGYDTETIRRRVAEMASFFGIEDWFYKDVDTLSGGQKQLLNLASVMAMQPSVLILDEPTSQLDPIAAADFLAAIGKINRELGTTILITEHRLDELFPFADRVLVMDKGRLICDGSPSETGADLKAHGHGMFLAMPTPMRVWSAVPSALPCPVTVRDGRQWLDAITDNGSRITDTIYSSAYDGGAADAKPALELDEAWFRYKKDGADILRGFSCVVRRGEFLALLGGNGAGKTTALALMSGRQKPYRGTVKIFGKPIEKSGGSYKGSLGLLPQNPQALFLRKTVREDLLDMLEGHGLTTEQKAEKLNHTAMLCRLEHILHMHPYDLSGGEQQRTALAKVLLTEPEILMLDEPTKGFDAEFKLSFAEILYSLLADGVTIIMVSHDVEFCAKYAHRCAMMFDGMIISADTPRKFFAGNSFYTTSANRMARHILPETVTAEDLIAALGGNVTNGGGSDTEPMTSFKSDTASDSLKSAEKNFCTPLDATTPDYQTTNKRALTKRTVAAAVCALLAIPLTLFIGIYYLNDRQYYIISMLIIFEAILPFIMLFEGRRPRARELVTISVLCAIGVAGRAAFFMLPQFKPVTALAIIAGIAFGGEAGFLFGAVTGFVSNFFFGQGPWTPWQMFAYGIIGFLAGILFRKGVLRRSRPALCIYGGLSALLIFGGIMNSASVLIYQNEPTMGMFIASYLQGIPFDLIHAAATVFFLWVISDTFLEKLDRVKLKYALLTPDSQ